jgi:myosin heavy subunit
MSPIARAFMVINLLLSGMFLAYAAFYLQQHDTFKTKYEGEVAAHQKTTAESEQKYTALSQQASRLQTDLQAATQSNTEKDARVKQADEENTALKARMDAAQNKLDKVEAHLGTVSTTIDNQNKRIEELTTQTLKDKEDRSKALAERDDMENRMKLAEASLEKSKGRENELVGELNDKNENLRKANMTLELVAAKYPDYKNVIGNLVPDVDGTVLEVNTSLGSVAISLGENQAGVQKGWRFAVHDGQNYKGEVRITEVTANMALGMIETQRPGQTINKGDKATTRLR